MRSLQLVALALLAGVVVFGSSSVLAARSSSSTTKSKKLSGVVVDSSGKKLAGVSVSASSSSATSTTDKKGKYSLTLSYNTSTGTPYTFTYKKTGYSDATLANQLVTKSYKLPNVTMPLISPTSLEVKQLDANTTSLRWQYAGERTGVFFTIERKRTSVIPAVTGGFSTVPAVPAETAFSTVGNQEYALVYNDRNKIINGNGLIAGQTYAYRVKAGSSSYSNEATVTITRTNDGQWQDFAGATGSGTCSDKIKNGDETGVDTGGRCGTAVVTPPPADTTTGTVSGTVGNVYGQPFASAGQTATIYFQDEKNIPYSSALNGYNFSVSGIPAGCYVSYILVKDGPGDLKKSYTQSNDSGSCVQINANQTATLTKYNFVVSQDYEVIDK